eukprot:TRINITY_DN6529_c0_g1_i4.p1 TRINITY_DN6529_c0_g1~~TRINITY_DN6529_c0_g1_i4.p1  ORF type:complete len:128 (+),score=4.92 TRINITY_DN6529_c0_g1_i4:90-473(+)
MKLSIGQKKRIDRCGSYVKCLPSLKIKTVRRKCAPKCRHKGKLYKIGFFLVADRCNRGKCMSDGNGGALFNFENICGKSIHFQFVFLKLHQKIVKKTVQFIYKTFLLCFVLTSIFCRKFGLFLNSFL